MELRTVAIVKRPRGRRLKNANAYDLRKQPNPAADRALNRFKTGKFRRGRNYPIIARPGFSQSKPAWEPQLMGIHVRLMYSRDDGAQEGEERPPRANATNTSREGDLSRLTRPMRQRQLAPVGRGSVLTFLNKAGTRGLPF